MEREKEREEKEKRGREKKKKKKKNCRKYFVASTAAKTDYPPSLPGEASPLPFPPLSSRRGISPPRGKEIRPS
jgi:hypothetical protein